MRYYLKNRDKCALALFTMKIFKKTDFKKEKKPNDDDDYDLKYHT